MKKSIARRRTAQRAVIERLMTSLHDEISSLIIDPRDSRAFERCDDLCQEIWQSSLEASITPWRLCLDRYCSCKLMLSEWEPEPLPGLGLRGPSEPWGW